MQNILSLANLIIFTHVNVYVFIYAALYHSFREWAEVGGIGWAPISLMAGTNYGNSNPEIRYIYFIYLKKEISLLSRTEEGRGFS